MMKRFTCFPEITSVKPSIYCFIKTLSLSLSLPPDPSTYSFYLSNLSLSPFYRPFSRWIWISWCYCSKGWCRWWWQLKYWSYKLCKAPVKSPPPTNQHAVFTGRMPCLLPDQHWQSTEGKISLSMNLLTLSSPGVSQLCFWPLIGPGYLGRVAMLLISPLMPVPQLCENCSWIIMTRRMRPPNGGRLHEPPFYC